MTKKPKRPDSSLEVHYESVLVDISHLIDEARRSAARSVSCIMTAAYWLIGRRIFEFEQKGSERADYGEELLKRLSFDLTSRYGRGFAKSNLYQMRTFYVAYRDIFQTPSGKFDSLDPSTDLQNFQTLSGISELPSFQKVQSVASRFPLPWSAYVRLLGVKNEQVRKFYETEALRGGHSQLAGRCLWRCFYPIRVMLSAPRSLYPPIEVSSLRSTAARGGGSPKSVPRPGFWKTLLELMP